MTTYTLTATVGSYADTGSTTRVLYGHKTKITVGTYSQIGITAKSGLSPVERMQIKQSTKFGAPASKTFHIVWWRR